MKGFLLDTNIPSELTRPHPQQSVCQWLESADDEQLYFSVVSLGEILKGITVFLAPGSPCANWVPPTTIAIKLEQGRALRCGS
jgi:hypothetical protein